ncbi:MAG: hypothetical protein HYT75_05400 [Deltaproteobacteria bacterium]|nr:hypothetical protein [Deltaproteobacteria bacterium]MBI2341994.1 hypothetical protein [Deltaproteobacteria bacterium]
MIPPFYGTKVVTDIKLDDIYPLIDTHALFTGRWQFRRTKASEEAYQEILKQKAWPAFEEWKKRCKDEKILESKVAYGYFDWKVSKMVRWQDGKIAGQQIIPLQLVTVGSKVAEKCAWLFASHKYTDYLFLHGLAVETTEALAEYWHRKILRELNIPFNAGKPLPVGARISPGYPAWPNLADQKELCRLLGSERISVKVSDTYQLDPEYSTSAMIVL